MLQAYGIKTARPPKLKLEREMEEGNREEVNSRSLRGGKEQQNETEREEM